MRGEKGAEWGDDEAERGVARGEEEKCRRKKTKRKGKKRRRKRQIKKTNEMEGEEKKRNRLS